MNLSEVTYPKDTRNRVQSLLVQEAHRTSQPAHHWLKLKPNRVVVRRTLLVSAAAAVLAGVLVVSDVLNLAGNTVPSTAQAAELLNRAAEGTLATSDPVVGPGQYLKLDIAESVAMNAESQGSSIAWISHSDSQLFVPHDRSGEWVLNIGSLAPTEYLGIATKEKVQDYYADRGLQVPEPGYQRRGLGGKILFGENTMSFGKLSPAEEATIPREPAALIDWIRTEIKGTDDSVWSFIADQLVSGVVPAKWRAVLYRAAAMIPGATVIEQQATLDGRTGTAVGRTADGVRTDIIFDSKSGLLIGTRGVNETGNSVVPAGTTTVWTSVRTSIADSAP